MQDDLRCRAVDPATLPARSGSGYPEPFRKAVAGRVKRALGDEGLLGTAGQHRQRIADLVGI